MVRLARILGAEAMGKQLPMDPVVALVQVGLLATSPPPQPDDRERVSQEAAPARAQAWGRPAAPSLHGGRVGQPTLSGIEHPWEEFGGQ
jgi:hypothetical protein